MQKYPRICVLVICSYTSFPSTWLWQFAILCLTPSNLLHLTRQPCCDINQSRHCMQQRPNVKANSASSSREISCMSRNPKFHYRTHKSRVPSRVNPAHIFPSHLNIHFNSTHPSTPFRTSDLVFHRNTVGYATTNAEEYYRPT
jgi:hypothetical protein